MFLLKYKIINNDKKKYLLFLHCICGNNNIFIKQFPMFSSEYNFILIDLPGHGESLDYQFPFSFDDVVLDIVSILNKENIETIDIISLSLGTMIATKLCMYIPKRINKIVFTGCVFGFSYKLLAFLFSFFIKIKSMVPRRIYMFFITLLILPGKQSQERRNSLYRYSLYMQRNFLYNWLDIMQDFFIDYDLVYSKKLSSSDISKIYIAGSQDCIFSNKVLDSINQNPFNIIYILQSSSHLCNYDSETEFNNIVSHFLS